MSNYQPQKDKPKKEAKPKIYKTTQSLNTLPPPPLPLPAPINIEVDYDEFKQPTDLSHYSSNSSNLYFPNLGWRGLNLFNLLRISNDTAKQSADLDSIKLADKHSQWLFHPNDTNIKRTSIKYQPPKAVEKPKEELYFERNMGKFRPMNVDDQTQLIEDSFERVKKHYVGMRHPKVPAKKCVKVSTILPNPWLPPNMLVKASITPSNDSSQSSSEPKHMLPNNTLLLPRSNDVYRGSSRLAAMIPTEEVQPDGTNYKYYTEIEHDGPSTLVDGMSHNYKDLLLVENEDEQIVYYTLMRKRRKWEQTDLYTSDEHLSSKKKRELFGSVKVNRSVEEDF
ncbi:hypothetical protein CONCODRAFT_80087 [Conidiobolus coronatus NRRL 28638]|uniref:Uncharacterized protein n=1 Tax=Conidiobolus coronatus (strain ATCC 28846 / CBS 209.66 / NRRL 28638) TaxID=796925 RepID=A0A137NXY8_CONC2|nr:hypothetical protein CONCODRAFT_80087 [Conidiobolus coronatus NRRL 28638]|eukprot:KXN67572.1 hypothetical protein CONCODRAFT_80087 [Conidiobolus coronatus NRRL 28638]